MARRFEPLGGAITSVEVDEDGFALIGVAHSACGASASYASGPLDGKREPITCGNDNEYFEIRGEPYGRTWKRRLRHAQLNLKRRGIIAYARKDKTWTLAQN